MSARDRVGGRVCDGREPSASARSGRVADAQVTRARAQRRSPTARESRETRLSEDASAGEPMKTVPQVWTGVDNEMYTATIQHEELPEGGRTFDVRATELQGAAPSQRLSVGQLEEVLTVSASVRALETHFGRSDESVQRSACIEDVQRRAADQRGHCSRSVSVRGCCPDP